MMILASEKQRKIENIYSKEQTGIRHTDTKNKSHTSLVLIFKYVLSLESPFCGRFNAFSESGYCIVFSLFFLLKLIVERQGKEVVVSNIHYLKVSHSSYLSIVIWQVNLFPCSYIGNGNNGITII